MSTLGNRQFSGCSRVERSQLSTREGSGAGLRLCTPNSTKVDSMLGLVVCSGRADKPRFIIVPLTLMTPGRPHRGSLVSTPVPRCGWPALILGAWRAPVLLGWSRDKAHTEVEARSESSAAAKYDRTQRYRGSSVCQTDLTLPCMMHSCTARLGGASRLRGGAAYVIDSRLVSLDSPGHGVWS